MLSAVVQETPIQEVESITEGAGWMPPSTQRAPRGTHLPETPARSPKRVQIDIEDIPASSKRSRLSVDLSPTPSVADRGQDGADKEPVCYVTTTTNNNRRAEQQREKKLAALREKTPYNAIAQEDESIIAWMIKQTVSSSAVLYSASTTPYHTASAVYIGSRWALALLGEAYTQKIRQIRQQDWISSNDCTRNWYGKGPVRTEAITALIKLVYPEPTREQHNTFRARLKQAMRWHSVVQGLGWGSLLLILHEEVPNRWIERVLRVGELGVFIDVVKRERPDLVEASKALESWLGPDGIAGGPISQKQALGIESNMPLVCYEIEEVADSEDNDDDNESFGTLQSLATPESTAAPAPLRQMSLLELFHPVDEVDSR
ncbi:hypothetical protein yc1106_07678 [Curvularia clavata]|uniref:Uncharacterized protein n=1 Tax=Curvularia clavata TaxID=95742 RepID=A0A9Q8ZFC2_CURCL|nr:hypothetical protein yc1106_07678 [Curvularia clavata]